MFDLKGKIAVVTGASSGLGRDAALGYAKEGANVAVLDIKEERLKETAEEIKRLGVKVLPIKCDVASEEQVKNAVEKIEETFGRIDILLNNAGTFSRGGVDNITEEDWDRVMNVNVKGAFHMSKYIIPVMKKQHYGKVVNISSANAFVADKQDILFRHSYNASKAGVIGLTRGMAASYAKDGITVNAVCPGLFRTELTEKDLFQSEKYMNAFNTVCPTSRAGKSSELNGTVLYFSSDASSYVTGQYVIVDGGCSIV